ncbi:MAG: aldo/keto reductase [Rhodospirillales bacterium]|nr:aldo/keto reductase [Rhodospirillales bacterium]
MTSSTAAPGLSTRSGHGLGRIGLGTMGLGGYFQRDTENDRAVRASLETAVDSGIRLFDTAEAYGGGHAEELLGDVLPACRDQVFISTKVSPENLRPDALRQAAYRSLERLRTDFVDLYYIHWPNPAVPIADTLAVMSDLVAEGVVRYVGLSNFMAAEVAAAENALPKFPISAVQAEYNLFDRTHEDDLLPYVQHRDICFIAYSPLDVGRLLNSRDISAVGRLAQKHELSPAQLLLKWVVRKDGVIAIPKAMTPDHVRENSRVEALQVPDAVFSDLEKLCATPIIGVDPKRIHTNADGLESFIPGVDVLAEPLRGEVPLKPVRLVRNTCSDVYDYDLVEGKLRYWAWVTAFPDGRPIPALIRH